MFITISKVHKDYNKNGDKTVDKNDDIFYFFGFFF